MLVIHNSPDVPAMKVQEESYDYVYCGSLCDGRLIKEIIEQYSNHSGLEFAFAGNDKYQCDISKIADEYANFTYFGTIPYAKVLEIESKAKVLSAIYEPTIRNHRLCAPNKFYEAIAQTEAFFNNF